MTAIGAIASPSVALIVALWVTWRTIRSDRDLRRLERRQDWLQQVHDRQLTSSADFAHAAFHALVSLDRLHPATAEPTEQNLADSRRALETARQAMAKIQLLFRSETSDVTTAAESLVDALNSAQNHLERRRTAAGVQRAEGQRGYVNAINEARERYEQFIARAAASLAETPEASAVAA